MFFLWMSIICMYKIVIFKMTKSGNFVYIYWNLHRATSGGILVRCRQSRLNSSRRKWPDALGPILGSHSFWFWAESDTRSLVQSVPGSPEEGRFWADSSLLVRVVQGKFCFYGYCVFELLDDSGAHGDRKICVYLQQHPLPEHHPSQAWLCLALWLIYNLNHSELIPKLNHLSCFCFNPLNMRN